jgi:protein YibB
MISIVTAFFDIGRGNWTPSRGLPHYLERSTDVYLERFSYLAKLENDIVVYTSKELSEKVRNICSDRMNRTTIIEVDLADFSNTRKEIYKIQSDPNFYNSVLPSQNKNPEYWNPDYVLVTNLKSHFTSRAILNKLVKSDMVAWIDFGYCRSMSNIPPSRRWDYNFDNTKIHLFNYKDYDGKPIEEIVLSNDVYILGAKVVASAVLWGVMDNLMTLSQSNLMSEGLVDDDQGLWLASYLKDPSLFELHKIPDHQYGYDPFVLFNAFNVEK